MGYTHIDCFSGPGGICTGMHAAGFDTKVAIEFIESCCDTYRANHPEVHVIHSDIRDVKAEDILPYIPKGGVDLVTSGMPCETFSTAGNTSRSFYDDRQFLFREGIRIAEIANAKIAFINSLNSLNDEIGRLSDFYFSQSIAKNKSDLDEIKNMINKSTKEDIVDAIKDIQLDTIYFLSK